MRVIGIIGSPRKGMNTDVLVQAVLEGCERRGASIEGIYLNDLAIRPCQACRVQDGEGCWQRDGMDVVYDAFRQADGLVIGTPVYYSSVSSQIKLMIDRSYCLAKAVRLPSGKMVYQTMVPKRKKGVLICVAGGTLDVECIWAAFGGWAKEVNLEVTERLFVSHAEDEGEPKDRKRLLDRLVRCGEDLSAAIEATAVAG